MCVKPHAMFAHCFHCIEICVQKFKFGFAAFFAYKAYDIGNIIVNNLVVKAIGKRGENRCKSGGYLFNLILAHAEKPVGDNFAFQRISLLWSKFSDKAVACNSNYVLIEKCRDVICYSQTHLQTYNYFHHCSYRSQL